MYQRTFLCISITLFLGVMASCNCNFASAQEATEGFDAIRQLGDLAKAANDLRVAAESFERFGNSLNEFSEKTAAAIARMSSEFDPFGYKTAFQTIGRQMEIIQQQNEIIRKLQKAEIRRFKKKNKQRNRKRRNSE